MIKYEPFYSRYKPFYDKYKPLLSCPADGLEKLYVLQRKGGGKSKGWLW